MKNVTISLQEDLARWLRVRAAEQDTSISRYIAELLARERQDNAAYRLAMVDALRTRPQVLREGNQRLPARDEVHDR